MSVVMSQEGDHVDCTLICSADEMDSSTFGIVIGFVTFCGYDVSRRRRPS